MVTMYMTHKISNPPKLPDSSDGKHLLEKLTCTESANSLDCGLNYSFALSRVEKRLYLEFGASTQAFCGAYPSLCLNPHVHSPPHASIACQCRQCMKRPGVPATACGIFGLKYACSLQAEGRQIECCLKEAQQIRLAFASSKLDDGWFVKYMIAR